MEPEIVNVDLNLNVDGDYERFISDLRERLAHHPLRDHYIATYGAWLHDHPLLPVQQHPRQPKRWIHINLMVQDEDTMEDMRVTVAIRDDNVFLMGFRNKNGDWYEFGFENKSMNFIQGSIFLGCDSSYGALLDGSEDWAGINLGKEDARHAVRQLWHHVGLANAATKRHLARICVMICECARMTPHYDTVRGGWDAAVSRIEPRDVRYIKKWAQMSRALIKCAEEHPQNLHMLNSVCPLELAIVKLVLNSRLPKASDGPQQHQQQQSPTPGGGGTSQQRPGSDPQLPQTSSSRPPASSSSAGTQEQRRTAGKSVHGRPLVEVCRVEAAFSVCIDTVVVFDGKRGQIIYKHDDHTESRSQGTSKAPYRHGDLVLTGPYRAISAEGSFVIQVDGIPGTDSSDKSFFSWFWKRSSDKSSKVSGELFWDCYAKDVVYDKVLTADVISKDTGGRLAEVRYAVWSDAVEATVEATVEVNLLLPAGTTQVYGRITTTDCIGFVPISFPERSRAVLFSRERDEKVELVPSSADSMVPLELSRSVIAVPVHRRYAHQNIWVQLHAATPNDEDDVLVAGNIYFDFDKHTGEIRVRSFDDFFVPVDWTGGSDPTGGSSPSRGIHGATASASHEGTKQTSVQQCMVQVNVTSPGFHISSHTIK